MTPAERSIRMRTNMSILTPGDRGYQEWADRRELLRLLDEERIEAIRLRSALEAAGGVIHDGWCSSVHLPPCESVREALR